MKSNTALQLFGLDAILHILAIIFKIEWLVFGTKPLLMIFLALYFNASTMPSSYKKWLILALVFSFGGDTLLMFHYKEIFFMLGLGSFLIGHIYYSYGMFQFPDFKKGLLFQKPWLAVPLVIYAFFLLQLLYPRLGDLVVPVLIYSMIITVTGLSALNLFNRMTNRDAFTVFLGAVLFIISDSVIAIDKFLSPQLYIPSPSLIIMTTYILGQYLMIQGFINHDKKAIDAFK